MQIHLIRTSEVTDEHYENVLQILRSIPGPLQYKSDPNDIVLNEDEVVTEPFKRSRMREKKRFIPPNGSADFSLDSSAVFSWVPEYPSEVQIVSWEALFEKCQAFREKNSIPDEEHVILMTYKVNKLNWFSGSDEKGWNHFIHADQWEYFLPSDPRFPVAYEVIACVIRRFMFTNYTEGKAYFHTAPKGCLNDFCQQKKEVTLKLRTGDICTDCMNVIIEKKVPNAVLDQVLKTFDAIRTQMLFRERYRNFSRPSRIAIRGPLKKIHFVDMADVELRLTPLERILYLFFLEKVEGVKLNQLCDHRVRFEELYLQVGNARTLPELKNSIDQLTDSSENSASEKISKIKKKIILLTGEEMARHFVIDGQRMEPRRISLDRSLVEGL